MTAVQLPRIYRYEDYLKEESEWKKKVYCPSDMMLVADLTDRTGRMCYEQMIQRLIGLILAMQPKVGSLQSMWLCVIVWCSHLCTVVVCLLLDYVSLKYQEIVTMNTRNALWCSCFYNVYYLISKFLCSIFLTLFCIILLLYLYLRLI